MKCKYNPHISLRPLFSTTPLLVLFAHPPFLCEKFENLVMQFLIALKFAQLLLLFITHSSSDGQKVCTGRQKSAHPRLEKWNVDPQATTVSGISNGGAFAVQISFIYSSLIHGAGIFAATPFPTNYLLSKWNSRALLEIVEHYRVIDDLSDKGLIDSTENLKGFRAFVFQGARDRIIPRMLVKYVLQEYKHYGADVKDMINRIPSGHCIPTNNGINDPAIGRYQGVCATFGYEGVSDMFSHFYGPKFVAPQNATVRPTGLLFKSDLSEFYPNCDPETVGLSSTAWTYVPKRCGKRVPARTPLKCKLHFAFHGYALPFRARVFANSVNAFVEYAGYLQAADANDVILIFPEANWRGYDVLGYTDPEEFVQKSGVQNVAIKRMIERVIHGH